MLKREVGGVGGAKEDPVGEEKRVTAGTHVNLASLSCHAAASTRGG